MPYFITLMAPCAIFVLMQTEDLSKQNVKIIVKFFLKGRLSWIKHYLPRLILSIARLHSKTNMTKPMNHFINISIM